jgi:hypothetical protein
MERNGDAATYTWYCSVPVAVQERGVVVSTWWDGDDIERENLNVERELPYAYKVQGTLEYFLVLSPVWWLRLEVLIVLCMMGLEGLWGPFSWRIDQP